MSTLYGVNADKHLVDSPKTKIEASDQGGRVRCIYDEYALTGDLSANDVIKMGAPIPNGARILDVHLVFPALGAGTLDVGYAASEDLDADGNPVEAAVADAFIDGEAVTNAGSTSMQTDHSGESGMYQRLTAAVQAQIKVATDTSATSGTIKLAIFYSLD